MGEHWYARNGSPAYTTNGRDTTLRDARKLGLCPSVTTVTNVIAKDALTEWLISQAILASLTLPRVDGESDEAWLSRIKVDGRAQAKAAAEEGTRIHDACEQLFKTGLQPESPYFKHAGAACDEVERLFPDVTDWVSEKSFAHPLGYGGKVDLHSPSTGIVVDFKTKDGDFSDGKRLHFDQNIQLAAYQVGLLLTDPEDVWVSQAHRSVDPSEPLKSFTQCANIFVSRTHAGKVASYIWSTQDIEDGWLVFKRALDLWISLRKYDPSWT